MKIGVADTHRSLAGLAHLFRRQGHDVVHGNADSSYGGVKVLIATNEAASPSVTHPTRTVGGNFAIARLEASPDRARLLFDVPKAGDERRRSPSAVEFTMGGWYDYRIERFLRPVWFALTRRRLGVGDVGPEVGPMTTYMWTAERSRAFTRTLESLEPQLKGFRYIGPFTADFTLSGSVLKFISCGCRATWEPLFSGITDLEKLVHEPADGFIPRDYSSAGLWLYGLERGITMRAEWDDPRLFPLKVDKSRSTGSGLVASLFTLDTRSVFDAHDQLYDQVVPLIDAPDALYRIDAADADIEAEAAVLRDGGSWRPAVSAAAPAVVIGISAIPSRLGASSDRRRPSPAG